MVNAMFSKERPLNVKRFYRNTRSIVMIKLYVLYKKSLVKVVCFILYVCS